MYAAGIVLYELLLGRTPFAGGHPVAVLRRHLDEPPCLPATLPDPLRQLLAELLAKAPTAPPLDPLPLASGDASPAAGASGSHPDTADGRATRVGNRQAAQPAGRSTESQPPGRRRVDHLTRRLGRAPVLACAVLLVGLAAGAVAWPRQPRPAAPAELALAPVIHGNGLLVTENWRLDGRRGERFHATMHILNPTKRPITGSVDEVVPKALAASVEGIHFTPAPDRVVRRDPVVRYGVKALAPGGTREVTYEIAVAPASRLEARLKGWAQDRTRAVAALAAAGGTAAPVSLAELRVTPSAVRLAPMQRHELRVAGVMSNRSPAPGPALGGLLWSSSDPSVVTVQTGLLVAQRAGAATITAQAGTLEARVTVTVTGGGLAAGQPAGGATSPPSGSRLGGGLPPVPHTSLGGRSPASPTTLPCGPVPTTPTVTRPATTPPPPPPPPPPPRGFDTTPDFTYFPTCGRPCWLPLRAGPDYRTARVSNGWPLEGRDHVWVECQVHGNGVLSQGVLQDSRGVRSNIWNKIRGNGWGNDIWLGNAGWRNIPC